MKPVRTFIALEPDPAVRAWLAGALEALRGGCPGVRWVRPEHVHLTLVFLGDVLPERIDEVGRVCDDLARGLGPLRLPLGPPGVFGPPRKPRTFWIGFEDSPGLAAARRLQGRLEEELEALGFPREDRGWTPHLTLGRNPRGSTAGQRGEWEALLPPWPGEGEPVFLAEEMHLFGSEIGPGGPVHRVLRTECFTGSTEASGAGGGRPQAGREAGA